MKIVNFSDVHLGLIILDPKLFYEYIWLPIYNRLRRENIDLVVFSGDLFHKSFPKDSEVVTIARKIIEDLLNLSKSTNNFPIRLIHGTNSHDANMFDYLRDLTKYGAVYKRDTSDLENKILKNIQNSKEYAISHVTQNDNSLFEDIESLMNLLKLDIHGNKISSNFVIYEIPTIERINGYDILFCPEVYDIDDSNLRQFFLKRPHMVFYHGMIEGAITHYHETNTSLIYNKSITLKQELINLVKMFVCAGHIHNRLCMVPYIRAENMSDKMTGMRAWYTGSLHAQTFADAGQRKGYDIITTNGESFEVEFVETKNSPKFFVYPMTKEIKQLSLNQLIQIFLQRINKNQGSTRVDVDTAYFNNDEKIKFEQFKAKFPNVAYKVINSKAEQQKEDKAMEDYKRLIEKPLKELIIEMCEGEISSEDYERYFLDMEK